MRVRRAILASSAITALVLTQAAWVPKAQAEFLGCRPDEDNPKDLMVISDRRTMRPWRLRRFRGNIVKSATSPTGRYIGALTVAGAHRRGLWSFLFEVLDSRGRTVAATKMAQDFEFSPSDRYVAVMVGRSYEGASGFAPDGVEIIDLHQKARWRVPELKDAVEVDWTTLPDEGLTLMAKKPTARQKVWKYRLSNRRCVATAYKGIHFSPDGEYYYMTPKETMDAGLCRPRTGRDSCVRAYSRANREIKLGLPAKIHRLDGWFERGGHQLMVLEGPWSAPTHLRVDLANGRARKLQGLPVTKWKLRRGIRITRRQTGALRLWLNR